MRRYITIALLFSFAIIGCQHHFEIKFTPTTSNNVVVIKDTSDDVTVLLNSMKNVDEATCILAYKQFNGLADYIQATKKVDNVLKLMKMIEDFQKDYGYTREKFVTYTDAVEAFLKKGGYGYPMKIVDNPDPTHTISIEGGSTVPGEIARDKVISDMRVLANAAKLSIEQKHAK
jgi:hypothetical protein